ncbi:hypothetical protein Dda_5577 [Drechslerella dactyloides]|uniref:Condensin complex subunit 2 n=1 Tax=Drechslerella dactyloides TaxID=74499 RepID=A0AAD6IWG0_DREDA|nr:hypothetical protein Dda_5577 [Drechslerella dactyloides]
MPRKASRPNQSTPTQAAPGTTITIPLNDDSSEKARRKAKRQTLQEAQLNKIIAAATPRKGSVAGGETGSPSVGTPGRAGVNVVGAQTPVKKVPILANFEEWMKMATDNKINATNSWNFALIDYFHDMSLLKEGNSINFQKASCTLDGCVKIYTSRVDSVATETGKLLSGLADNSGKKKDDREDGVQGQDGEGDDDDEEGTQKKARKRATRSEVTLAKDWSQLQLKKFDLEFAVDPLFKKAAADFDEGGAKGLLLNVLSIDDHGRIVFDSSDDVKDSTITAEAAEMVNVEEGDEEDDAEHTVTEGDETANLTVTEANSTVEKPKKQPSDETPIDLNALASQFFPNLDLLDELDVCPSLKNFALGDPAGSLDIPFLKALTEKEEEEMAAIENNDFGDGGFEDDDDFGGGGFDIGVPGGADATALYGQGGEAWATENMAGMLMTPGKGNGPMRDVDMDGDGEFNVNDNDYIVKLGAGRENEQEDILAYFDEALKKNWAGPEHWRIRRIKEGNMRETAPRARKEKTPFIIDFVTPDENLDDSSILFATSNASINLPKTQLRSKTRNLLPDDKHFNSRQLLRLFLKPKAMLRSKKTVKGQMQARGAEGGNPDEMVMDEQFWAQNEIAVTSTPEREQGDYDANFFHDEPLGGMDDDDGEFADAREMFSPDGEGGAPTVDENGNPVLPRPDEKKLEMGYGAQLVMSNRRVRPEYVQYARVAKKVDVRKLKETMWRGMEFESIDLPPQTPGKAQLPPPPEPKTPPPPDMPRTFTSLMNGLKTHYPKQAMNDISTSYCFISLLHLANEKGLQIAGDGTLKELYIVRDLDAEVGGEY